MRQSYCTDSIGPVKGLKYAKSGYGFIRLVLDNLDDHALVRRLQRYRRLGRQGFHPRTMLRLLLLQYLLNAPTDTELLHRVAQNPALMELCGLARMPSNSTLSRFKKRLTFHMDLLDRLRISLLLGIRRLMPGLGQDVALDSTDISTYANGKKKLHKRADQEARWGVKHSSKAEHEETIEFFGYKWHLLADCQGIPLSWTITPGNTNDTTELSVVVKKASRELPWLKPKHLMADRGYDSLPNHEFLDDRKITPIIHIRKPTAHDGLYDGIYDEKFRPACLGSFMDYIGTHAETGEHIFACPAGGCDLKARDWMPSCRDVLRIAPGENLRVICRIHRGSEEWKDLYKKRTSVERVFSSMKLVRKLDTHCLMGYKKVALHITLSALTYLGTVLGHLQMGEPKMIRHMAIRVD